MKVYWNKQVSSKSKTKSLLPKTKQGSEAICMNKDYLTSRYHMAWKSGKKCPKGEKLRMPNMMISQLKQVQDD